MKVGPAVALGHEMTREEYGKAYERGFDRTVRFLLSRGAHSTDIAKDAAQSAWTRGWEKLGQLRDAGMVATWVNMIALNLYRSLLRREPCYPLSPELIQTKTAINVAAIDLHRILQSCSPADRSLLEQQMLGNTAQEIALREGITAASVRLRSFRARRAARLRVEVREARAGCSMDLVPRLEIIPQPK